MPIIHCLFLQCNIFHTIPKRSRYKEKMTSRSNKWVKACVSGRTANPFWKCRGYLCIHSSIQQWLYSPLLGPGCFFSFVIPYTAGRTPWTGDQPVARPLPTNRATETQNKCIQTLVPRVEFENTTPAFRRVMAVRASDREATVISGYLCMHVLSSSLCAGIQSLILQVRN
jgi:hypothetical protein